MTDERDFQAMQTEGDLEQREAEQEQAARLVEPNPEQYGAHPKYGLDAEQKKRYTIDLLRWQDEQEQDPEAKDPYGEHWQKLMRGKSKSELIAGLQLTLEREQKAQATLRGQGAEIERLRAENEARLESCKNLRRAAMFAYNLTSGRDAWYDKSNEVEGESNAGVFLTIIRAEEEKLGLLL